MLFCVIKLGHYEIADVGGKCVTFSRTEHANTTIIPYIERLGRLWLELTTFHDLLVPGTSAIDRRCTQIGANCKLNWRNF